MKSKMYPIFFLFFFSSFSLFSQNPGDQLFDDSYLHEIRITFDDANFWETLTENYLEVPFGGSIEYLLAATIEIDGQLVDSVGVRQKGFSSHFASNDLKKSLKIDVNKFVSGKKIDGLKKFNLHNGVGDPALQRDLLAYDMMRKAGIKVPRLTHTRLYLNDQYWGVYVLVEQLDKDFLQSNFVSGEGNLFKNMGNSALEWEGNLASTYDEIFDLKTNEDENDWSEFIELVDVINNSSFLGFQEEIEKVFHVDQYLRVLAIDVMTNNWDSYIEHGRNFYLYHEPVSDLFYWIPWDYNLSMGGDFFGEGQPVAPGDTLCEIDFNIAYIQDDLTVELTPAIDSTIEILSWSWNFGDGDTSTLENPIHVFPSIDVYNVCVSVTFMEGDSSCMDNFCQILDLANNPADCPTIVNGSCPYPASDPIFQQVITVDGFCCDNDWDATCQNIYDDFEDGDDPGGPGFTFNFPLVLDGSEKVLINRLMLVPHYRQRYLDYCCQILDENLVFDRLEPIIDFHGDKIRDAVYEDPNYLFTSNYFEYDLSYETWSSGGAIIPPLKEFIADRIEFLNDQMNNVVDYDCENLTAGLTYQDITINEFAATNDTLTGLADAAGEYDDWIELYNNTSEDILLDGYYLTDNFDNSRKWAFPTLTTVAANDYLIVWADQQLSQDGLHAPFRLNQEGEELMLVHSDGTVIDSVSFGQQLLGLPSARVPNGTGDFVNQTHTFDANNENTTSIEEVSLSDFKVFPNPAQEKLFITAGEGWNELQSRISFKNNLGQTLFTKDWDNRATLALDLSNMAAGIYFLEVVNGGDRRTKKVIVQ